MKTRSIAYLAASLLALSISQPGFAQEDSSGEQKVPAEAAAPDESSAAEGEASDEAAEGEQAEAAEAPEAAEGSEAAEGEAQAKATSAEGDPEEPKVGPGGKPLREDYPGTDESKKARMETERIEGLNFEEGEAAEDSYDVRIRELETKVDDLKEKVFRSKSRIVLLKETVLTGNLAGSRAIVSHVNDIGGSYVLKRAHYALDGSRVFNKTDNDGSLADKDDFELYNGSITPGAHRLSVLLELKGSGYGLFSYMDGYKFTIKDSCDFTAQEGRSTILKVRLIDRGGAFAAYEERPAIECVLSSVKLSGDGLEAGDEEGKGAAGEGAKSDKDDKAASK
ncbi:hypothetical protein FIV42_18840 [Persicimonas caeni]|jgi:hypothetical protein|uniref:Dihydrolipoamide acetyltransferase n=1 Tax=Persicimonas caeni TaxID=2292766 RepID=A0A4Y6PWK8_PERCE|nr:hypothetical protein [Persicimonas caeni]QDG52721.1 hypothetical protein FIV42_18840 [Persicimonas caeni]QED33943.1 hypothetical protein FRD00_18835 [Persicimonas caeni]